VAAAQQAPLLRLLLQNMLWAWEEALSRGWSTQQVRLQPSVDKLLFLCLTVCVALRIVCVMADAWSHCVLLVCLCLLPAVNVQASCATVALAIRLCSAVFHYLIDFSLPACFLLH
jgi:hypothetical protein